MKKKRASDRKRKIRNWLFIPVIIFSIFLSAFLIFAGIREIKKEREAKVEYDAEIESGFVRQNTEEALADDYIKALIELGEKQKDHIAVTDTDAGNEDEKQQEIIPMAFEWLDENYYTRDGITYTPDYAEGYLAFVLEYPKIRIRRGVYHARTYAEMDVDLANWMTVLYNPNQMIGKTHLAIMAHNSLTQDLSFNNVRESEIGDTFFLYAPSGIYVYQVTDIFCDWRSSVTQKYILGEHDKDICYLITCGRDDMYLPNGQSTRYRDFIIEAHLVKHYDLDEYGKFVFDNELELQRGDKA